MLGKLYMWLSGAQTAALMPDGSGTWGDVLSHLYRLLRDAKAREAALNDSLDRFQEAANALPDGVVMLDIDNNIVWCNPVAETHWRISLANDRMQTITYFIRYPEFNAYLAARDFNQPLTLTLNSQNSQSDVATYTVQLVAFGDDQSLVLSRDISERSRLERMRSDFVANVSHELRTPLTVMAGFLETIEKVGASPAAKPELLKRSLEHMCAQTERMQRLVDDLLVLSRLEDAQNKLTETTTDFAALVNASIADAGVLSNGRHQISSSVAPAWVTGNRDELSSAISNLVSNAVRYTAEGGAIHVSCGIDETTGELLFQVSDNGDGIPAEHIPRLTERFYRVDRGRSRAAGGTGLGLAIVKHVLMRHDGRLDIESHQGGERHGSTFSVTLPPTRVQRVAGATNAVA
ncbi:MAG: phosphate regulon sensor histidine kinase PhoR [Gammaproteobacteria bacterium]|nr:phosphate regulon sensor histidine kinase PhoR [Gammaproteobacteria bacterium]